MKYRPEVDGLRAIAVLPVMLFHAGLGLFSGGYVGVDVFFVISGYLITNIIHTEISNGTFSIVRFYERRVRRILPALFLVSLVCIPFAWLWMLPSEFRDFAQSVVAVNLFASNILFWQESGYFAAAAELKPLLHTWTLAVEEQFYLFFPWLLLLVKKLRRNGLFVLLAVLSVLSLVLAEWGARNEPTANFYLLPTRAWELGVGALVAVGLQKWSIRKGLLANIASTVGLAAVAYAVTTFDNTVPFPSVWALIPVIGSALVVVFASQNTVVGRILSWKPLVGIGLISYSAYLWHQPLFAFARIRSLGGVPVSLYLLLGAVSIGLAYLSWRFVEQPFRRRDLFSRGQVFVGAAAAIVLFLSFGLSGHVTSGYPGRLEPTALAMVKWSEDRNPWYNRCHTDGAKIRPEEACVYNEGDPLKVAIWGDSHANAIAHVLGEWLNERSVAVKELTAPGCIPAVGLYRSERVGNCPKFSEATLEYLIDNDSIEVVVMMARYTQRLEGERFDNKEGGLESGEPVYMIPLGEPVSFIDAPDRIDKVGQLYRATIEALLDHGKRVVLVYPVPEVGWHVPERLAREAHFGLPRTDPISTSYEVFKERNRNTYEQLDKLSEHVNLIRVYPEELICNTFVPNRCVAEVNGRPLYNDDDHFSSVGASLLVERIVLAMEERDWF